MRSLEFLAMSMLVCAVSALADTPIANPPHPRTPDLRPSRPVMLTGDLGQLRVLANGDFSGWVLIKPERSFSLNVASVQSQARALSGQRVAIKGILTTGNFHDGTPFQQVRVTSISQAP